MTTWRNMSCLMNGKNCVQLTKALVVHPILLVKSYFQDSNVDCNTTLHTPWRLMLLNVPSTVLKCVANYLELNLPHQSLRLWTCACNCLKCTLKCIYFTLSLVYYLFCNEKKNLVVVLRMARNSKAWSTYLAQLTFFIDIQWLTTAKVSLHLLMFMYRMLCVCVRMLSSAK